MLTEVIPMKVVGAPTRPNFELSKALTNILRHGKGKGLFRNGVVRKAPIPPHLYSEDGALPFDMLMRVLRVEFGMIDENHVRQAICNNNKGRFQLLQNEGYVGLSHARCVFGHSFMVEPDYHTYPIDPALYPSVLYHCSLFEHCQSIFSIGIVPGGQFGGRQHVFMQTVHPTHPTFDWISGADCIYEVDGRTLAAYNVPLHVAVSGAIVTNVTIPPNALFAFGLCSARMPWRK